MVPDTIHRRRFIEQVTAGALGLVGLKSVGCKSDESSTSDPQVEKPPVVKQDVTAVDPIQKSLNDAHAAWSEHVAIGDRISSDNPLIVREIFTKAVDPPNIMGSAELREGFLDYEKFTSDILVSLTHGHGYTHERIRDLIFHLRDNKLLGARSMDFPQQAFKDTQHLLENKDFMAFMGELYKDATPDCDENSSIYAACYLTRLLGERQSGQFELTSGLYMHPTIAPTGAFHQWISINGKIVDPSIYPDDGYKERGVGTNYIPIVSSRMKKEGTTITTDRTINCFPREMEENLITLFH